MWNPISNITSTQTILRLLGRISSAFFGTCDQLLRGNVALAMVNACDPMRCANPRQTDVISPAC